VTGQLRTVERIHLDSEDTYDVLCSSEWGYALERGQYVNLVDCMPRLVDLSDGQPKTIEHAICDAARVSYSGGTKKTRNNAGLIRYMLRHKHTSPFEMVKFKFSVCCPLFVARQWVRHRMSNTNEESGRYSELRIDNQFLPMEVRANDDKNKQATSQIVGEGDADWFVQKLMSVQEYSSDLYLEAVRERGIAREQARCLLGVTVLTRFVWCIDLHNLLHFLTLRRDPHAQKEIRDFADGIYSLIGSLVPDTIAAYEDCILNSITLTQTEINAIVSVGLQDPSILNQKGFEGLKTLADRTSTNKQEII